MRRRLDALFSEPLVLDLLLVLDHPLFLLPDKRRHLVLRELLVLQQVFVDEQRSPRVRGGITRLLRREMAVLPVRQLLRLGYLLLETDGEQLLQTHVQNTVLRHQFLDVNTVRRRKIAPAPQAVDVVLESQPDLAYIRVGEEIR